MNEAERLRNDREFFEDKRLELADELMDAAEIPMSFFDAMELAEDRLMAEAGF